MILGVILRNAGKLCCLQLLMEFSTRTSSGKTADYCKKKQNNVQVLAFEVYWIYSPFLTHLSRETVVRYLIVSVTITSNTS